jgi:pimeloyl-ACP methyl ester carboxylesterase
VLVFLTFTLLGQSQIKYGSNENVGKYLFIKGTKVYFEEYGIGTPLLLLHGGFGSISDFQKCIKKLSGRYRVIIPDAPGLGRSDYANTTISYNLLADYNSKLVDQLKLDSLYILGWSDDTNWVEKNLVNWIKYYRTLSSKDWKRYVSEVGQMWFKEQYFPKENFNKIQIPVMLVYGDKDMYTIEHGLEIHYAIKNSQFCVIPNCTHEVFWDKPELINQIAIDFFDNK